MYPDFPVGIHEHSNAIPNTLAVNCTKLSRPLADSLETPHCPKEPLTGQDPETARSVSEFALHIQGLAVPNFLQLSAIITSQLYGLPYCKGLEGLYFSALRGKRPSPVHTARGFGNLPIFRDCCCSVGVDSATNRNEYQEQRAAGG
jgi:hypothetical protein